MDVIITRVKDGDVWELRDLLGRTMGTITKEDGGFLIAPAGEAVQTMSLVHRGHYSTLDDALAEIETRTRSLCRRAALQLGGR